MGDLALPTVRFPVPAAAAAPPVRGSDDSVDSSTVAHCVGGYETEVPQTEQNALECSSGSVSSCEFVDTDAMEPIVADIENDPSSPLTSERSRSSMGCIEVVYNWGLLDSFAYNRILHRSDKECERPE